MSLKGFNERSGIKADLASGQKRKAVTIFATSHELQGLWKRPSPDPEYEAYIGGLLRSRQFDFVFEEASERSRSTAQALAGKILGNGHYCNVNSHHDNWPNFGNRSPGKPPLMNPDGVNDLDGMRHDSREVVGMHDQREKLWIERMKAQPFTSALFICGIGHGVSFALRLQAAGYVLRRVTTYLPHDKLCPRPHKETDAGS